MRKKTQEEFVIEVFNKLGDNYLVLGRYINSREKVEMKHLDCGSEYKTTRDVIMGGGKCPNCFGTPKKTTKQFLKEIEEITNGEYELIGGYETNKRDVTIKHINCGEVFNRRPDAFIGGQRCPKCRYTKARKTPEQFAKEVYDLVKDDYTLLSEYVLNSEKIYVRHNECGYEYKVKPNVFLSGRRCPACNDTKGEKEVAKSLDRFGLNYKRQHEFEDCKYIKPLPFDFAVLSDINEIVALIEYQGEQHYKPIKKFGGKKRFEEQLRNDNIKREYCKNNNIKLIEIPYYDFDKIDNYVATL